MPPTINDFLNHHAKALSNVTDRQSLSTWHQAFAQQWFQNAVALADSANKTFGLSGEKKIQDEVAYLATESTPSRRNNSTWILLSLNPGWRADSNALERRIKGCNGGNLTIEDYEAYRTAFFPRWYDETIQPVNPRYGGWWNAALNFLHHCESLPAPARMAALDPRLDVIGWELWPLFSTSDGLSAAAAARPSLSCFARASIQAALRFSAGRTVTRGVVLASRAGYDLLTRFADALKLRANAPIDVNGIRLRKYTHPQTGRVLWAIRRQLFAARTTAAQRHALAAHIANY